MSIQFQVNYLQFYPGVINCISQNMMAVTYTLSSGHYRAKGWPCTGVWQDLGLAFRISDFHFTNQSAIPIPAGALLMMLGRCYWRTCWCQRQSHVQEFVGVADRNEIFSTWIIILCFQWKTKRFPFFPLILNMF